MVTKPTRMQSRRTNTAGKVFSASELLEGELGLNLPNRKLYSKDANNNVFQIGGEPGRDVGQYVAYEDFFGSGNSGIGVRPGKAIWLRRDVDSHIDYTSLWITRNPIEYLGAPTGTNHAFRVDTTIDHKTNNFEWGVTSTLAVNAADGGEHCAGYFQAVKRADGSAWSMCFENRDFVQNPQSGTVTLENGLFVKGGDPLNRRIGIHVSLNASDNLPILSTGIVNKIGAAMVIGGPSTHVRVGSSIIFQGDAEVHVDLTEIDGGYHDVGVAMIPNQKLSIQNPKTVNSDGSRVRGTERAALQWSSLVNTWAISGVPVTLGAAGAGDRKMLLNVDGANYYINLTLA